MKPHRPFLLGLLLVPMALAAAEPTPDQIKFFETKIRPVLANNCYKCHSESQGKSKGGLVLDSKPGWMKGGDSGAVIVPGDPAKSLLIKAVQSTDLDEKMPPEQSGLALSTSQIADLEAWVKMGAPDPRAKAGPAKDIADIASGLTEEMQEKLKTHWAFQPITSPPVPTPKNAAWAKNPVDQFVLAKLEEKNLTPSAPADKRTLIRRAYFDLIGLPPTPDEVIQFVNDESPDAFAKVVENLLARPQYGERWGRYWLDVARYADTRGEVRNQQNSLSPFAWTYRDYVIKAFNSDRPFDQFIKEQIAADLLPTAKSQPGTLAALGFLTEGEQFQGNRTEIINDQIDVVTKGFLGLTVSCARCHDHFFDPIPTRDYYSLFGIFNSCEEPAELPVIGKSEDPKLAAEYQAERKKLMDRGYALLDDAMNRLAGKFNNNAKVFMEMMEEIRGKGRLNTPEAFAKLKKAGLEANDIQAAVRALQFRTRKELAAARGVSDEMTKEQLKGLDKKDKREFKQTARREVFHPVLEVFTALHRLPQKEFAKRADGMVEKMLAEEAAKLNPYVVQAFKGQKLDSMEKVKEIYAALFKRAHDAYKEEHPAWKKSVSGDVMYPGLKDAKLEEVRTAVFSVKPYLGESFEDIIAGLSQNEQRLMARIPKEIAALDLTHPGSLARANVLYDVKKPQDAPVLYRGEAQNKGPLVPRQTLEVIQRDRKPVPKNSSGRLELAESIASPKNPLTGRVLVNRVWQHHFGQGFVSTPDDLGTMSEPPSHRELCDWLAHKFMAEGWSVKNLHRTIMLSATYQQASDYDAGKAKIDPFNRLLWRANVRRLDFEAMRDSFLSMGGKIDLSLYGHPVNIESEPYSPRRAIYGFVDRLNMAEFMKHFDMPNPQLPTGRRHQTTVPQQSLFKMNSLLVIEQARNIIDRVEFKRATTDPDRVKALYEIIYQRWPKADEIKVALEFVHGQPLKGEVPGDPRAESVFKNAEQEEKFKALLEADPKTLNEKQRERQAELKKRMEQRQKKIAEAEAQKKRDGKLGELVRDPNAEKVDRSALDKWEKFAHALLMTNEVCYVN